MTNSIIMFVHLTAAAVAAGGSFFVLILLWPRVGPASKDENQDEHSVSYKIVDLLAPTVFACLLVLIGSGVPIAFGTDSGPAGRFPGYFEHLEFGLMADAGLTAREIMLSATSVAADCLSLDDVGTLGPGRWADFIVYTANPVADIAAARTIQQVYVAGNAIR